MIWIGNGESRPWWALGMVHPVYVMSLYMDLFEWNIWHPLIFNYPSAMEGFC
jgi:hypothetical protein